MTSLDNITDNPQQRMASPPNLDAQFSLSVEDTAVLFMRANVARSPRTISRYCENGYLDCKKKDFETYVKYLISPASVELRIKELQSIAPPSHISPSPVMTSHDTPRHDMASHDKVHDERPEESQQKLTSLEKQVKELQAENLDLKITNKGKDYFIDKLEQQNTALVDRMTKYSRYIGILKTKLLQIEPPKTYAEPVATTHPIEADEELPPERDPVSLN